MPTSTPQQVQATLPTSTTQHESPTEADDLRSPFAAGSPVRTANWRRRYARRIWFSDLLVLMLVVFGTQVVWFGRLNAEVAMRDDAPLAEVSYWVFSVILVTAWMGALALVDSRSERVIGMGTTEYVRVVDASLRLFGIIAIVAFLARVDVARGFLLLSLPFGILCLASERWLWRQWLVAKRRRGDYSAQVLLVGSRRSVELIARELSRMPAAGYRVIGACVPSPRPGSTLEGSSIPIVGDIDRVQLAVKTTGADTVAITSADELSGDRVKHISWSLEAGRESLVLAPSILDIAGPRVHMRSVSGLPLVHVETPHLSAGQRIVKRSMDVVLAGLGLVLISPLLLIIALAVRCTSPGPVIFRQTRIGLAGRPFTMLKFRSMIRDAEDGLAELVERRDAGNEVLFKMRHDPRVTRVGRIIRRYSLDELPQLINVLAGSMSLVGPRPPLPHEVERYDRHVHRRFLVKPGITGLWQVSGRTNLSWSDSVRLDLWYVENWTVVGDIVILAKTARAVLAPRGAT